MGKGKQRASKYVSGGGSGARDQKALRTAVEEAVNEGVKIQDSAEDLPPVQAAAALEHATATYRDALERIPGHAEAAYNLATCLSEQADLKAAGDGGDAAKQAQVALLLESRGLLEGVIARDTSRRGATTALAHHALGNVIRGLVEVYREHCPSPCVNCPVGCPGRSECMEALQQACRHFDESIAIRKRSQNQLEGVDEVLVHWGDAEASMMQMVVDGDGIGDGGGDGANATRESGSPLPGEVLHTALALCSNACGKYTEAMALDTSSGESDTDTLRLKAGVVVDLLEWALPVASPLVPATSAVGFDPEALLATAEQAVGVLLGLDGDNLGGLLAMGDLCRLRARLAVLLGAGVEKEGRWREASVQWFARAVAGSPHDAEALSTAGEGALEYGRRALELYRQAAAAPQGSIVTNVSPRLDVEAMKASAVSRLQEAGNILSRAASMEPSDTGDSIYNAACAFALSGDENSCLQALAEYCRRTTIALSAGGGVKGSFALAAKREAARRSLREIGSDGDFEGVRGTQWFAAILRDADLALAL